ncbi:MAG: hypothetical protein JNL75_11180 [Chitinophagales bacterium]|nr:hypothetical protein [Chitinophagales bacterium]
MSIIAHQVTNVLQLRNEKITEPCNLLFFEVESNLSYGQGNDLDEVNNLLRKEDSEFSPIIENVLKKVEVSLDTPLIKSKNLISNLTLHEIALAAQTANLPILLKATENDKVIITVPYLISTGQVPFSNKGWLNVSITSNNADVKCQLYAISTTADRSLSLNCLYRDTAHAGQFTPIKYIGQKYVILDSLREIDLNFSNGVTNTLIARELDFLNNSTQSIGVVAKNHLCSNYSGSIAIDLTGWSRSSMLTMIKLKHAEDTQFYYSIIEEQFV